MQICLNHTSKIRDPIPSSSNTCEKLEYRAPTKSLVNKLLSLQKRLISLSSLVKQRKKQKRTISHLVLDKVKMEKLGNAIKTNKDGMKSKTSTITRLIT